MKGEKAGRAVSKPQTTGPGEHVWRIADEGSRTVRARCVCAAEPVGGLKLVA